MEKTKTEEARYARAWLIYFRSYEYERAKKALVNAGIKQPYLDNILKVAFRTGWKLRDEKSSSWAVDYHVQKQEEAKKKNPPLNRNKIKITKAYIKDLEERCRKANFAPFDDRIPFASNKKIEWDEHTVDIAEGWLSIYSKRDSLEQK